MSKVIDFARFAAVEFDEKSDRIWVKFEVLDPKYREFALRIAQRDDITLNFVGERLELQFDEPDGET